MSLSQALNQFAQNLGRYRFMEDTMKKRVEQPSYWNSAMTLENVYQ